VTIWKLIDQTTPQLFEALLTNESVEVQISFYRPDLESRGKEVLYYTITLFDGSVSEISQERPSGEHATVVTCPHEWYHPLS